MLSRELRIVAVALVFATAHLYAQQSGLKPRQGLLSDWTQRHLILTDAATAQARLQLQNEPRLQAQWRARRQAGLLPQHLGGNPGRAGKHVARDWSVPLAAGRVAPAMSPAKFTFDINATPDCASDYVVFGLDVPGFANQAVATISGTSRSSNVVTITTSAAHGFSVGQNVTIAGVTDTSFNGSFSITSVPSSTTFTYAQIGGAATSSGGSATINQANLIALNNLYSGSTGGTGLCGSGAATVMWAYNVSTAGGSILTSPVISLDGQSIAFVESVGGGSPASIFHILTVDPCTVNLTPATNCQNLGRSNGTDVNNPAVPGSGNLATLTSLTYASASDSRSSLWVDYHNSVAYVAADNATLYRILHVFDGGTPQVDATWSVTLSTNCASVVKTPALLTGPVQVLGASNSLNSGYVFIGDDTGCLSAIDVASHTVIGSLNVGGHQLGSFVPPVYDPPIVDASDASNLSVFATSSSSTNASVPNTAAIVQAKLVTSGPTFSQVAAVSLGSGATSGTPLNLHAPAFDNTYLSTPGSGALWACGTGTGGSTQPFLYRLPFVAGTPPALGTPASQGIVFLSSGECSPFTEFANPNITPTDLIFFGVTSTTNTIFSWNVTGGTIPSSPTASLTESGGTSGVVVDNVQLTTQQGSSIYFTTLAGSTGACSNMKCAVKLTQAAFK